jgi:hypothetical protein
MMMGVGLGREGVMCVLDPVSLAAVGIAAGRVGALMEGIEPLIAGEGA